MGECWTLLVTCWLNCFERLHHLHPLHHLDFDVLKVSLFVHNGKQFSLGLQIIQKNNEKKKKKRSNSKKKSKH